MTLELRTLGVALVLSITLQTLALALQWRVSRDLSGPGWWALGNAGIMFGSALLYLNVLLGLGPVVFVAAAIMWMSSLACMYQGVRRFLGQPTPQRAPVALIVGATVFSAYFAFLHNITHLRGMLSLLGALFCLLIARAFHDAASRSRPTRALVAIFAGAGAFFVLRSVAKFTSHSVGDAPTGGLLPWLLPQPLAALVILVTTTLWS
ncbi:MAG: hypothetical protein WCJ30_02340 [Deltaproteobacteria bacterium]